MSELSKSATKAEALATYIENITPAQTAYEKAAAPARAAYHKAINLARAAYERAAGAMDEKAIASLWGAYQEAIAREGAADVGILDDPARAAFEKAIVSARAAYNKATAPAKIVYDKARAEAEDAYEKSIASA